MKWTVLSDNRSDDSLLSTEHGLSILLETTNERAQCDACINIAEQGGFRRSQTERHKILLDTGASDVFIRNAEQMGILTPKGMSVARNDIRKREPTKGYLQLKNNVTKVSQVAIALHNLT